MKISSLNLQTNKILSYLILLIYITFCNCSNSEDVTPELLTATISSTTISSILAKSVIVSAFITDDGNSTILERGFVWSTENNPTMNDNILMDYSVNTANITATILSLNANTEYFVRAFAKNSKGTSYGEEVNFTTDHNTYEGIVRLKTQGEIEAFGKNDYTKITSTLFIGDTRKTSDISSLNSLVNLEVIGGGLNIQGFNPLTKLSGLENLTSIGAIYIQDSKLTNIDELTKISSLDGGSSGGLISFIANNDNLVNIDGLKNIKDIASYLHLSNNPLLTNLNGLKNLTTVRKLIIESHPNLIDINGLTSLNSIDELVINNNQLITNLEGLKNISSISSSCKITQNIKLNNFCAFTTILSNDSEFGFTASGNLFNPTKQDLVIGNCSQ